MVTKATLILFAQALLVKCALSQCLGRGVLGLPYTTRRYDGIAPFDYWGNGGRFRYGGFRPLGSAGVDKSPSFGGNLMVTSCSPIAPTGLRVTSENTIEGILAVVGKLPFLGVVVTDGAFPSAGAGAVSYECGDGSLIITAENGITGKNIPVIPPAIPRGFGFTAGVPPFGLPYGRGLVFGCKGRCGCGYGVY